MTHRAVITDREVRRAKREGKTSIDISDAVVTPSGRDAAKVVGIELVGGHASRSVAPKGGEQPARGRDSARTANPSRTVNSARGAPPEKQSASSPAKPPHRPSATASVRKRHHHRRSENPASGAKPAATATPPASAKANGTSIAIGADHGGVGLKDAIGARLRELGHTVTDLGTTGTTAVDYPDFAVAVARAVADGKAKVGIMIDGAGIGSCMAANKVAGARAAMCYDLTTATNAREHNDANVLTLGAGLIGTRLALEIVERFLTVPFAGGRHAARVDKVRALDATRK